MPFHYMIYNLNPGCTVDVIIFNTYRFFWETDEGAVSVATVECDATKFERSY